MDFKLADSLFSKLLLVGVSQLLFCLEPFFGSLQAVLYLDHVLFVLHGTGMLRFNVACSQSQNVLTSSSVLFIASGIWTCNLP